MELFNNKQSILRSFQNVLQTCKKLDLTDDDRFVIFSDHHRGDRRSSDYFQRCEKTYNAALGHYLEKDFHLVLLGDVEELWQFHPKKVMKSYPLTYALEKEFFSKGKFTKIRGNHDHLWENQALVEKYLWPIFPGIEIEEGLSLFGKDRSQGVQIFLAHGHQGTFLSDTLDWFISFWFRILGSAIIQPFKHRYQTPARSYSLREEHETLMFECADALNRDSLQKTILIAGHTHHPIFMSQNRIERIRNTLKLMRLDDSKKSKKRRAKMRALYEFIEADLGVDLDMNNRKSYYFNTGCCSFADHSITGIEISKGKIRLIRWSDLTTHAERAVLGSEKLQMI